MTGLFSRAVFAGGLALFVAGCAATGADFKPVAPSGNTGVIYVYRTDTSILGSDSPTVTIDGESIGQLKEAGFLAANVAPGKHTIEVRVPLVQWFGGRKATVNVAAGTSHYFRADAKFDSVAHTSSGPIVNSSFHIAEVPASAARAQISKTKASN